MKKITMYVLECTLNGVIGVASNKSMAYAMAEKAIVNGNHHPSVSYKQYREEFKMYQATEVFIGLRGRFKTHDYHGGIKIIACDVNNTIGFGFNQDWDSDDKVTWERKDEA